MPFIFLLAALLSVNTISPPKINSTESLIAAMHRQYQGKWPRTYTFTQHNTHYAADTVLKKTIWQEAIQFPDKFRIDFSLPEGNAVIFSGDSVYNFKGRTLQSRQYRINHLIMLTGGIHFLKQQEALRKLEEAGFKTEIFREDTWQGRKAYVVGASRGDEKSSQFWIDAENLYLLRVLTLMPDGRLQDGHFGKHIRTAGGWIETEVLFFMDGKKVQLEEYKEVKANASLPEGLFKPESFGKVHWMR
jgi:outer membrane lipoprotein-sorting protein